MKELPLSSHKYPGLVALVDDDDYERVAQYSWYPMKFRRSNTFYAASRLTQGDRRQTYLHKFVLPVEGDVDHKDGNGLNCQVDNLRPVTDSQNMQNRAANQSTRSGFKGVTWMDRLNPWFAKIGFNGKRWHLGSFSTPEEAARAYDSAARELFGEYAKTNFKEGE